MPPKPNKLKLPLANKLLKHQKPFDKLDKLARKELTFETN